MRLLADECVAGTIVERLRSDGFDIVRASDVVAAASDEQVLATAHQDGRVLITADQDFGELAVRFGLPSVGIVNLALGELSARTCADITAAALHNFEDRIIGNLVTVEPGRVRIRPLPPRLS
jgi:predicted nuclease of predicted toxin-antitoxin system